MSPLHSGPNSACQGIVQVYMLIHAKLAAKASKNFHQRALVEWLTYSVEVEYAEA